jgi:hypothetical protein
VGDVASFADGHARVDVGERRPGVGMNRSEGEAST